MPHIVAGGHGGAVIITSSAATTMTSANIAHYTAAKHGLIGLMRVLAKELAPHRIRVNSVHPTNVRTAMIDNEFSAKIYRPDLENPTFSDSLEALANINMWDVPYLEVDDVANATLFLASEEAAFLTGNVLEVDGGRCV